LDRETGWIGVGGGGWPTTDRSVSSSTAGDARAGWGVALADRPIIPDDSADTVATTNPAVQLRIVTPSTG
jgi:hypothetical protein